MKSIFNRTPLTPNTLAPLSLGSIHPEGWLRAQMEAQAKGITGRLREIWPDVGDNCAWLGGDGDSWERAPYYLDGLIPLAWGLDDEALKKSAMDYIEWILSSQREDGWFGPEKNDDYWPLIICVKALYQYFTATLDKRVLQFMDKFFKYEYKNIEMKPLKGWACARGGDNMLMALMLYNITGQKYLIELCKKLKAQTLDWPNIFHTFPNIQPTSRSLAWERLNEGRKDEGEGLVGADHPYFHTYYHQSHGVNVAMGLKTPGVINMFKSGFKEQGGFKFGWQKLMKHHGVAYGMFTCDEHLNGSNPSQGTESCAVVEAMYSIETLLGCGDFGNDLPDILEKLAFNALPAFYTADTMGHQYDQQANQISATDAKRPWYNNGNDSNLFGLEPNFGCCTANCHQGWPKFVSSLWYATNDDGLSAVSYAPCKVKTVIDGVPVRLTVGGGYPFSETVEIEVSVKRPIEFPLYLRVPFWAKQPTILLPEGEIMSVRAGEVTCIRRKWISGDVVKMEIPMEPRVTRWSHQSAAIEIGPLLMAYQPKENWTRIGGEDVAPLWQVTTDDRWNRAIIRSEPMKAVFQGDNEKAFKCGEAPVKVLAKMGIAEDWGKNGENADQTPIQPVVRKATVETVELVPYGFTSLRISQFPFTETAE
ncbi:MAG: glycoside hydrolase family 127 protein [Clostridia bacterium]|nr:glycoside hydrolase family 127 protein [Clostridia bacterium]MBQ4156887.1 glycoside hydrolase family 127 protein [Clostridia bacterium]